MQNLQKKKKEVIFLMSLCKIISITGRDFLLGSIEYSENGRFDLFDFFFISEDYVIFVDGFMQNCFISFVRPEKFQFLEIWQNRNFGYEIVILVKNPKFIL